MRLTRILVFAAVALLALVAGQAMGLDLFTPTDGFATANAAGGAILAMTALEAIWNAEQTRTGGSLAPLAANTDPIEELVVYREPIALWAATGTSAIVADALTGLALQSTYTQAEHIQQTGGAGTTVKPKSDGNRFILGAVSGEMQIQAPLDAAGENETIRRAVLSGELLLASTENRQRDIRIPLSELLNMKGEPEFYEPADPNSMDSDAAAVLYGVVPLDTLERWVPVSAIDLGRQFTPSIQWHGGWTPPVDVNVVIKLHGVVVNLDKAMVDEARLGLLPPNCERKENDKGRPVAEVTKATAELMARMAFNRQGNYVPRTANLT